MNKNICTECGTENEGQYQYCKNCGAPIKSEKAEDNKQSYQYTESVPYSEPQGYSTYTGGAESAQSGFASGGIDGIPEEEISIFIGKKAHDIMPKFSKMELAHTKVSWCWPAAVLGFLLGPLGAALWFFYRKMYKPAMILSVIGAVVTLVTSVMTIGTASVDFEAFFNAFASGDYDSALGSIDTSTSILSMLAELIGNAASIGSCILCGLFGYHFYKEHCINKIHAFRTVQADQRYYRLGLASVGGVSGGMLAVGIIIMLCVNYAASFITTIAAMII